jgi:aryl-alcohol dehydrogenase-like predicted oxidoreductase
MTFGTTGWGIAQKQAELIVELALEAGVNFFDTANSYAEGRSEEIVGQLLEGRRDKLILATKVFNPMGPDINDSGTSRWHIMQAVEESLRRLRTDYIDLYQIHHVDRETTTEERLRALDDLVRQGKVRYIGGSNEYAWRLCDALWISQTQRLARYESLQPQYNLLTRDIEEEVLPLCREKQLGVIVWGPLAGGYLTGKYRLGAPPPKQTRFGQTDSMMRRFFSDQADEVVATLRSCSERLNTIQPGLFAPSIEDHIPGRLRELMGRMPEQAIRESAAHNNDGRLFGE